MTYVMTFFTCEKCSSTPINTWKILIVSHSHDCFESLGSNLVGSFSFGASSFNVALGNLVVNTMGT